MSRTYQLLRAAEYEARGRIQEALVCEDEAARQSALDELMQQDRALYAGRQLSRDWTGPLGMPMPAPQFAPPRLPRQRMACRVMEVARKAWPDVRALWRRLPELGDVCILIPAAALDFAARLVARDFRLWALSWRVVLLASVELAGMPPVAHHEPQPEAFAFALDLDSPELWTAVEPF